MGAPKKFRIKVKTEEVLFPLERQAPGARVKVNEPSTKGSQLAIV
jgi:hypothetical protein